MEEIAKKQKMTSSAVYYSLNRAAPTGSKQNRKSGRLRCTAEQEDKCITMSSLRKRCLTGTQLVNTACKRPQCWPSRPGLDDNLGRLHCQ